MVRSLIQDRWTDHGVTDFLKDKLIGGAIDDIANAIIGGVTKALGALGSMWLHIGTPSMMNDACQDDPDSQACRDTMANASSRQAGESAPGSENIETILGWATQISLGICVLALIAVGVRMALGQRGEGQRHIDRITMVLVATILVSAAVSLVTALVPTVSSKGSSTVAYIQNSLWWYMIAFAAFGIIVGAVRMAWEQRAEPGIDLVKSLLTLVVVNGAGLTAVTMLTAAGDSFAIWILDGALEQPMRDNNGASFSAGMTELLFLTTPNAMPSLGAMLVILLGLLVLLTAVVQIFMMVVRAGMLVVLAGMLPIAVAATNTETGKGMFQKTVGWLVAFILYKPVAAIVYATAFKLSDTGVLGGDESGMINTVVGLTLMVMAVLALPALMSLIMPAVSAVSSGAGVTNAALAGAAAIPAGAIAAGKLLGGGSRGGGGPSPTADTNDNDSTGKPDGAAKTGGSSKPGASPTPSPTQGPAGAAAGGGGATAGGATAGGGAAAAGGGAAAAGGGGAAAGGATAGTAAGPVGVAVGAAAGAVGGAVTTGVSAVQAAAENESGGSSGSK